MLFSTSGPGSTVQIIAVYQNDGTQNIRTTITIDPTANGGNGQVTVNRETAPLNSNSYSGGQQQAYAGTTNGVVYVNGNIGTQTGPRTGGVSGTIANNVLDGGGNIVHPNNLTLVTDSTKNVNINGNLTYRTVGSNNPRVPNNASAVFGIVSNKVQIIEKNSNGDTLGNIRLDATVFAYDTFDALNALTRNYLNPRSFTLTGGYIAKNSGTFAGIDANGMTWTGFIVNRNYDSRVANPPAAVLPLDGKPV